MTKKPRQSINAVPELDEKISALKKEISGYVNKILGFLENEDVKKGSMGGLIEFFRNRLVPTYKHIDEVMNKQHHERSHHSDNSQEKKWELNAVLQELSLSEVTLLTRIVEDTKQSFKIQAASQAAALTTNADTVQHKLYVLNSQKKAADATIAKQRAEISKLTEGLTRAANLKLELDKINEKNMKISKKLLDQVKRKKNDLESTKEEVDQIIKVMHILQLKEAEAQMASEVGEKINQTLEGMDTFSVNFEVEFGHLMSRIYEIENEFKVVMKWIADNKTKHGQLKQEIGRLVEELKEEKDKMEEVQKSGENEMRRLNQSVKKGEEKKGELEKMIAEKDEQMKQLETKITEKESLIWSLSKTLESVITTATTKISNT